jgi:hypothetical protein
VAVDRSGLAPANRRAALATGTAFVRSTHHCADKPSPPPRIVEHIPSRSVTLIGTAPDAARRSSARFLFGGFGVAVETLLVSDKPAIVMPVSIAGYAGGEKPLDRAATLAETDRGDFIFRK